MAHEAQADVDTDSVAAVAPTLVSDAAHLVEVRAGRRLSLARADGGAHADTAVFLVHGAGGNQNQWRALWRALAAAGYRTVAFDFPGHGASPRPRDPAAYRGSEFLADLLAVLEAQAGARNVVIAHSYGARLALAALLALRDRGRAGLVERAVLLGAQAPDARFDPGLIGRLPPFVLSLLRPMFSRQFRTLAWAPEADPALVDAESRLADRNPMRVFKALVTQGLAPEAARLGEIGIPVLALAGAADRITPAAGAAALVERLPDARLEVLARCGHQIMLEQPGATARAVLGFIGAAS